MKSVCLFLALALSAAAQSILGTWLTTEGLSKVEVKPCGNTHCGTIIWMKNPRNDSKNADPALRSRPLLGAQILTGDSIYSPDRGRAYDAKLVFLNPDTLEIRVSVGLVKRNVTWTRVK